MSEEKSLPTETEAAEIQPQDDVQAQIAAMSAQLAAVTEELAKSKEKNETLAAALDVSKMEIPNDGHIELDEAANAKLQNQLSKKNVQMLTITIAGAVGEKNRPVFVGVQGVGWKLSRGVKLKVPHPVVHALSNAIKTHYNCDLEGNIESSEIPLYPFTVHI